jgi:pimeloyl-ACP methyl ester carboxylesterase
MIFRIQLAKLRLALSNEFELIFVNGPHECEAGPGVLPLFAGAAPFYCWFGNQDDPTIEGSLPQIHDTIHQAVTRWEATKSNPEARIVGMLSFSEGALVSSLLLWQQQHGEVAWLPRMSFAALICCYFPAEATEYMRGDAALRGKENTWIDVPTLHLHGRRDFCLARSRKLVQNHYQPRFAEVVEFSGGHHCPKRPDENEEMIKRILGLSQRTAM